MEISHQQVVFFLFVLLNEFCDCRAASNIIRLSQMILTNCPKYSQYMPYCPNFYNICHAAPKFTIHTMFPQIFTICSIYRISYIVHYIPCCLRYSHQVASKLLSEGLLLTALELHTELLEAGRELPRLDIQLFNYTSCFSLNINQYRSITNKKKQILVEKKNVSLRGGCDSHSVCMQE